MSIVLVGSTSGSITLQEPAVAGTTVLSLPAVTGTVLTDTSPKAGNVIQVVSFVDGNQITTTSTSFVSSPVTLSITPTSVSSKIFISVALAADSVAINTQNITTIYRNNTTNLALGLSNDAFNDTFSTGGRMISTVSMQYLDSPATTSSTNYTVYFKSSNGNTVQLNVGAGSVITLMEIAG